MVSDDLAVMVFANAKSGKEDMTPDEKKAAVELMKEFSDGKD